MREIERKRLRENERETERHRERFLDCGLVKVLHQSGNALLLRGRVGAIFYAILLMLDSFSSSVAFDHGISRRKRQAVSIPLFGKGSGLVQIASVRVTMEVTVGDTWAHLPHDLASRCKGAVVLLISS